MRNGAAIIDSPPAAEQRVILSNVSWDTFERLIADTGDHRRSRFAYDRGTLEIMSPQSRHERCNWMLGYMFSILAEELGMDILGLGTLTCRREDLERGLEPDNCFYTKNAALFAAKNEIDLTVDLPPDVMIEIDISRSSLNKLPIYEGLQVAEVWRYNGDAISFLVLAKGRFEDRLNSPTFPGWPLKREIPRFLAMPGSPMGVLRQFRAWVRKHKRLASKRARGTLK